MAEEEDYVITPTLPEKTGAIKTEPVELMADGGEEEEIEIIPRQGLLEEIQKGAQEALRINLQATFQPKTAFLPPPRLPQTRATITTGKVSLPSQPKPSFELSKPGQRVTSPRTTSQAIPSKEIPRESKLVNLPDPEKLTMERGSYTLDQLKIFLRQLGLKTTGNKAELVARLREALGYD